MRFVVYSSREGLRRRLVYRWRLVAGNGEIIATGEAYTREADAARAIRTLTNALTNAPSIAIEHG